MGDEDDSEMNVIPLTHSVEKGGVTGRSDGIASEDSATENSDEDYDSPSWNVPRRAWNRYLELDGLHQTGVQGFGIVVLSIFAIILYNSIVSSIPTIASFIVALTKLILENILVAVLSPMIAFQLWLYKKIRRIEKEETDMETARPDGGRRSQPRNGKGRFKEKSGGTTGGGILAGAVFGAAMGAQYGGPQGMIAGAIIGGFLGNELEKE